MSLVLVRAALETALAAISPSIDLAWENMPYTPVAGTPYAAVFLMTAPPANLEMSSAYTERGYLQVNLQYPLSAGPSAAAARAQLIRDAFPRGASFTSGGVTVNVSNTPEISPARIEADRYLIPVKIPFHAHLRSN